VKRGMAMRGSTLIEPRKSLRQAINKAFHMDPLARNEEGQPQYRKRCTPVGPNFSSLCKGGNEHQADQSKGPGNEGPEG
jgi:hypothetical protein